MKKIAITLISAIVLVLAIFVFLTGRTKSIISAESPKTPSSKTPVAKEISDKIIEPVAEWSEYDTDKFSLKYPSGWRVDIFEHRLAMYTIQPKETFVPESEVNSIVVSISGHCLNTQCITVFNLDEMVSQLGAKIVSETKVGDIKAYKVLFTNGESAFMFINGEDFYLLNTLKYPNKLEQIFSTFKLK